MNMDDLYFKNNFTKEDEKINLDINKLTVGCINSKNNKFNLDSEGNLSVNSLTTITPIISSSIMNAIYPVGSIYMNITDVNPEVLFGGSWEKIEEKFLLGAGSKHELDTIGGEEEHTLTIGEMPSHNHNSLYWYGTPFTIDNGSNGIIVSENWGTGNENTTHGFSVGYNGGNQSHNNMPPYLTVNMWKRIA